MCVVVVVCVCIRSNHKDNSSGKQVLLYGVNLAKEVESSKVLFVVSLRRWREGGKVVRKETQMQQ